jgi:acyl carrier protein
VTGPTVARPPEPEDNKDSEGRPNVPATITTEAVEQTIVDALPQFGVDPSEISRESSFEELDVDSLHLAELSQIIEEEYGVQLKGDDVKKIKTVGDVIDLVVIRAG